MLVQSAKVLQEVTTAVLNVIKSACLLCTNITATLLGPGQLFSLAHALKGVLPASAEKRSTLP